MSTPGPGRLLLFVGGDPDLAGTLSRFPKAHPVAASFFVPGTLFLGASRRGEPRPPEAPWLIPPSQMLCVERLAKAVERSGATVKVVDVNRPGDDRALVERYVNAEDVLPIVVRPDGARLEGEEAFTPAALRKFVTGR